MNGYKERNKKESGQKDDSATAKSYIQGVFQTLGVTEEFLFCDINFFNKGYTKTIEITT